MDTIYQGIVTAAQAMSIWEVVAVILGVAYLVLAMRQNILCWYAALGSTAIFSWLFWDVSLVMESGLNVYYLIMAVYGWWVWRGNAEQNQVNSSEMIKAVEIKSWSLSRHALIIVGIVLISLATGYGLEKNTSAALPYLDSFTTWGAVVTTYMVAQKVLENWLYWLVIDTVAIYLYIDRELYLTALLMAIYVVLAVLGWFMWLKEYRQQDETYSLQATA
ncbi:MAG: nicotinamide mononucleotide transporter [Marinoscillum sp.]|jgi:nicotinamide mononucleotide transporter